MLEHELTAECRSILRQSAELARLGAFVLDPASGRCVYCSPELARMHGLTPAACMALIGTPARLERIHPDDREGYRAAMARACAEGRYQVEYRLHDGTGFLHLREQAEQVANEAGTQRLVGCVQDVSASERIEAALQGGDQPRAASELEEREHRLRTIADGIPLPIIIARISQPEILFVNALAAEMFEFRVGPQPEAIRAVYVNPKDRKQLLGRVRRDGRVDGFEVHLRRADGSTMWALLSARVIAVAGEPALLITVTDITSRIAAEAELEEREERFRAVAEGVPLAVTISRLEPPEILFANARAEETFGLRAGDGPDAIRRTYVRPDDRRELIEQLGRTGRVDNHELQLRRVDGSMIWTLISARPIGFHGEPAMLTAVTEIHDLKIMEQALRDSEARLAAFMENAPIGMFVKGTDGRYMMANPEMARVMGRAVSGALGLSAADVFPRDTAASIADYDRELLVTGASSVNEHHLVKREAYAWIMSIRFPIRDHAGAITHIGGFAVDITGRKAMEEALKASEQRFRVLAEAHPVPLFIVRLGDGRIMVATPPCEALLKVPLRELIGSSMLRFCADPETSARVQERIGQEGSLNGLEVLFRRADGGEFWGSLTSRLLTFEGERAMVAAIVDLTESKRIEAELERQTALLHQNEKLSALGSLLAGVAHELNNPLSLVVGYAGLLEETAPDDPTRERALKVRVAADRCARIVRTFLSMARNKPRAPGPVHLNEVVDAAIDIVAYGLRTADVEVERALAPDLPPVLGDADQLHQVLANLLINAQQALQTVPPPRRLRIATGGDGDAVWVAIADNGPGIPAAIINRIFEPFFTTKPQGVGTGVGLSVSHGIIAAHGGQILVDSEPGRGSTFTIRLVRARTGRAEQVAAEPVRAHRSARILVVDDEPEIARLLTDILEGDGHQIASAASGRQALDWLEGREVDLIISDLRMPDMDGPSLYHALAERRPELLTRVVFITGDTLAADLTGFLSETGVNVIEKPLDPPDVSRRVQGLLADYEELASR